MFIEILTAVIMQSSPQSEGIIASLQQQSASYEPRQSCSVTVTTTGDVESRGGRELKSEIVRFDRAAGHWRNLEGAVDEGGGPPPRDWYARALDVAAAAESITEQDDGTFLLSTESLPKGIVANAGRDLGSRTTAVAHVTFLDGEPVVTQYNISLKEPFRIPLIVKGKDYQEGMMFDIDNAYGPLPANRTRVWDVSFPGGFSRGRSVFTYSEYDCPPTAVVTDPHAP